MFRPSRKNTGKNDRFLMWKIRLFVVGAGLAFAGMALDQAWPVWAGMTALAAALVLRFWPRREDD